MLQITRTLISIHRFVRTLKMKVSNLRHVEGSIAEAYLVEETGKFASYYYPPEFISTWREVPRNDDGGDTRGQISLFNYPGRFVGRQRASILEGRDKNVAKWYIQNNSPEAAPYIENFSKWTRSNNPLWSDSEVDQHVTSEFPQWFEEYFIQNQSAIHDVAYILSSGAARFVTQFRKYI
ncbi:uncharacterized protein LOC133309167 [Gastrolobium bilobum]|uniref:uncharacterized protein LOC133309167 n=1 Tax=Gastrolobium bilobum TaxID=150636 RepID=UPI002AAFD215|nr:uncharacterized protein LOC133309167 [Gastrolobium bilobum]